MSRLFFLIGCILLPVFTVFAQPVPLVEKPDLKVGDRWVFRNVDLWKNEETAKFERKVTGANGDNIEFSQTTINSTTGANVGRSTIRKADQSTWTFINPRIDAGKFVTFAFPLEVGKVWEYEYSYKSENGDPSTQKRTAKVETWEEVQVPAGKFKTLKVVHSGYYTRRSVSYGTYSGSISEIFWYAPEVKAWVKREYRDTMSTGSISDQIRNELTEYQVK